METFTEELSRLLDYPGTKTKTINSSEASQGKMGLLVYKIKRQQDEISKASKKEKIILCMQGKEEKQKFSKVFGSMEINDTEINQILNEFHNESRHKDSHISVLRHKLNE